MASDMHRLLPKSVGRRGACLIGIADVYIIGGIAQYLQPPKAKVTRDQLEFLFTIAPAKVWAGIWVAVGVFALIGAFAPRLRSLAYALVLALLAVWTVGILAASVTGAYRAWASVAVYSGLLVVFQTVAGWHDGPLFHRRRGSRDGDR